MNADNPKAYLNTCLTNAEQEARHNGHAGSDPKPRPFYQLSLYCSQCLAPLGRPSKSETKTSTGYITCKECGYEPEGGDDCNITMCDGEWNDDQPPPRKPPHDDRVPF
jgi:hypothetical protein